MKPGQQKQKEKEQKKEKTQKKRKKEFRKPMVEEEIEIARIVEEKRRRGRFDRNQNSRGNDS